MAMKIWQLRVYHSLFGRNVNQSFSNDFMFRGDAPLGDERFENLARNVAPLVSSIQHTQAQTLRCVIQQMVKKGQPKPPHGSHMPFYLAGVGQRQVPAGQNIGLKNVVAVFGKTPLYGFAGTQRIRGCFMENDIGTNPDGTIGINAGFAEAPFLAFARALPGAFSAQDFEYVLPAINSLDYVTFARPVLNMNFQGAAFQQVNNSRTSLSVAQQDLAKREVAKINRDLEKSRRNEDGTISPIAGKILEAVEQALLSLVAKYGIREILKLALPAAIKPILLALA